MKTLGQSLTFLGIIIILLYIIIGSFQSTKYHSQFQSYYTLSKNATTIEQKAEYFNEFLKEIDLYNFENEHDAIIYKSESNSFNYNHDILKEYKTKLDSLSCLNLGDFDYSTALIEINNVNINSPIHEIKGIWFKTYHPLLWNWFCTIGVLISIIILIIGIIIWSNDSYYW